MCVYCLAFSAMTLFSPVTEAPQPPNTNSANVSNVQAGQVQSMPVAEETRISITELLKRLPNSPDARVLREEFQSLQTRLAGVNDDAKAEAIINNGLDSLSKRVMAEPNSDQIIALMTSMLVEDNPQLINSSGSELLQSSSSSATSSKDQGNWGWLR